MAITTYATLKTAVGNFLSRSDLTSRIPEFIALAEDRIAQDLRIRAMEATVDLVLGKVNTGGTVGGTANAITVTHSTAITLSLGASVSFTATATNTSTVTLNVDSTGATAVKKGDGTTALEANDIVNGGTYHVYYDGTQWRLGPRGSIPLPSRFVAVRRMYLDGDSKRLDYIAPQMFWTRWGANETSRPECYTIEGEHIIYAPQPDASYYGKILYYRRFAALSADADANWLLENARGLLLYGSLAEAATYISDGTAVLKWSGMYKAILDSLNEGDRRDRIPKGGTMQFSDAFVV